MASRSPYRLVTNLKYWLVVTVAVATGVALLWASGLSWAEHHASISTLVNQLGGLMIASVAISALWDLVGRRSFFNEMLDVIRLKQDIHATGLVSVGIKDSDVVDWADALASAKRLDIFAVWATTWRNSNQAAIQNIVSRSNAKVRVILPDHTDGTCLKALANRFNKSQQEIKTKITDAIADYKKFDGNGSRSGRVEIYTSTVYRAFSAYRVDDNFIITLYHHKGDRSGSYPAFNCSKDGTLFPFFEADMEGVVSASRKIYP